MLKKYIQLKQLEEDKSIFEQKINFYELKKAFDEKKELLTKELNEIKEEKKELIRISNSIDTVLKHYIAELHAKIFPNTWQKNYGEDNIIINLSNIEMLTNLQKYKNKELIKDKHILEDKSMDIFQKVDLMQTNRIKYQLKEDIIDGEIMENEKYELSLIKDKFRQIINDVEKYQYDLKANKIKCEISIKINKKLKEILKSEINKKKQLSKILEEKNNKKNKNLKIQIKDNYAENLNNFANYRSFSDKNIFSVKNTRKKSLKLFEDKNKKNKIKINPYLIKNYKEYKSPLLFLKKNKNINLKLFNNNTKLVNAYDFLNIFSTNSKYNSINDIINNINTMNSSKLSFYSINEKKSTKGNTISSNSTINNEKKVIKSKNIIRNKLNSSENNNEIYLLRDYLYDLIDKQKSIIKYLNNKKAEEIRSIYQIKTFISKCIDDLYLEIYDNNKIKNDNLNIHINKEKEDLFQFLTYIFDNCFSGIKYIESIFPVKRK